MDICTLKTLSILNSDGVNVLQRNKATSRRATFSIVKTAVSKSLKSSCCDLGKHWRVMVSTLIIALEKRISRWLDTSFVLYNLLKKSTHLIFQEEVKSKKDVDQHSQGVTKWLLRGCGSERYFRQRTERRALDGRLGGEASLPRVFQLPLQHQELRPPPEMMILRCWRTEERQKPSPAHVYVYLRKSFINKPWTRATPLSAFA